jgi:hypothetical protein
MQAVSPKTTMGRISFLVNVASSASPRPTTGIHPPYLRRLRIRISPSRSVRVIVVVASVSHPVPDASNVGAQRPAQPVR